ncbi:MAG TPA: methylated-DNA--[protein]-cysteine S-methyltransferase [Xanthobacteraceae bacterium]|nr:methylated-DNA--[protein]-cysteine S-methyltransferase [Xanthobacteraceae bacterium]
MTTGATSVHHHVFDTAIGPCGVAWNDQGLTGVQLPEKDRATTERRLAAKAASIGVAEPPPAIAAVVADIRRYLAGEAVDFAAVAVDLSSLDPFRQKLYGSMRSLAWGETTTYGDLAKNLGITGWEGARDVGEAMGRNPVPVVIPCHRVLAAGGKLGGFSAHGGATTKAKLLALEGVRLDGKDRTAPRLPGL